MQGLSLVVASGGHSSSRCAGLSLSWPLLLRSTGSRCAGSVIVAHGPSCSAACGIFPDQGSNPCPLHWQADSQPLRHQGSPTSSSYKDTSRHGLSPLPPDLTLSTPAKAPPQDTATSGVRASVHLGGHIWSTARPQQPCPFCPASRREGHLCAAPSLALLPAPV